MASFLRFAAVRNSPAFVAAAATTATTFLVPTSSSSCDAGVAPATKPSEVPTKSITGEKVAGMQVDAQGDFHGLFPKRQLFQPKIEYPLWDDNWDGLKPESTGNREEDSKRKRQLRKEGVTRHIILIRHGQYDESEKDDAKRILTPLGRQQADETGKRIAEMIKGADGKFTPCNVKVVNVSGMARANETADIIASHLPGVHRNEPDPLLNEGRYGVFVYSVYNMILLCDMY